LDRELSKASTSAKILYLLKNFEYMAILFTLTAVYFITTGI